MKKIALTFAAAAFIFAANAATADSDIAAGAKKAERCGSCHGSDGIGIADLFPNLAKQKIGYMKKQLHDFQNGKRTDPIMVLEAKKLSDQDIADISAFYHSLSGVEAPIPKH